MLFEDVIKNRSTKKKKSHWETPHIQNYSASSHNVYYRGAQFDKGEIMSLKLCMFFRPNLILK